MGADFAEEVFTTRNSAADVQAAFDVMAKSFNGDPATEIDVFRSVLAAIDTMPDLNARKICKHFVAVVISLGRFQAEGGVIRCIDPQAN